MNSYVVAVDIGGTSIKTALLDRDGRYLWSGRWSTSREGGPDAVIAATLDAVVSSVSEGTSRSGQPPRAVGIACLGAVDEAAGIARHAGAIGWHDVELRDMIAARVGLPTVLGHDLRAAALAELCEQVKVRGETQSLFFMAIGTGIGAAIVAQGSILTGANGLAGEFGHIVVEPVGYDCVCGARGCLEAEASATAIVRRYAEHTGRIASAREIASLSAAGDDSAASVWQTTVRRLARGMSIAAGLLDPAVIVIGGGVSLAGDTLFDPLRAALTGDFHLGTAPPVVPAILGDRAATVGAGMLAWRLADAEEVGR